MSLTHTGEVSSPPWFCKARFPGCPGRPWLWRPCPWCRYVGCDRERAPPVGQFSAAPLTLSWTSFAGRSALLQRNPADRLNIFKLLSASYRQADWLAVWRTDWRANELIGLLVSWRINWLTFSNTLSGWLTKWLIDWLADLLSNTLSDWVTEWLIDWLVV